jgi:membrane fusion protein, copper/silver efflux system
MKTSTPIRQAAPLRVALLLALVAAPLSCDRRGRAAVETRAGDFTVAAEIRPDPPAQKGNTLQLRLTDAHGAPVEGADVQVDYLMPAMGAMSEMRGKGAVKALGGGRYAAGLDFPMGGSWTVRVDLKAGGATAAATYGVTIGRRGLTAESTGAEPAGAGGEEPAAGGDEVVYYTCSMHPSVRSKEPGTCPICSMDLVPVKRSEAETGVVMIDAQRRQTIGVTTAPVQRRPLTVTIRAVGKIAYDQTRLADVSVKYEGWIGTLYADTAGQEVHEGEPLFTLYSPDLYATQQELLTALASQRAAAKTSAPDRADYLVRAARQRLRLWDLRDAQIDRIARSGEPLEYVPILSPVSGAVVEKNVVEGAAVQPGMKLFRIADLDRVWVEAEVYESELALVHPGDETAVTLPYLPDARLHGRVAFVYPYLDDTTRTGRVRIELDNPGHRLKPDMYANVELQRDLGERLAVPEQAILYAGARRFVFLDLGQGRLKPQRVEIGQKSGDLVEITSGLRQGDRIVTSGNFLIAAESRLKLALEHWK